MIRTTLYQKVISDLIYDCEKMGYDYVTTMQFIDQNIALKPRIHINELHRCHVIIAHLLTMIIEWLDHFLISVVRIIMLHYLGYLFIFEDFALPMSATRKRAGRS